MGNGFRNFLTIWFGQLVSLLGSGLTVFGLGVWVYQTTGAVTEVSLVVLASAVPFLLISPLAGALIDRWDRRWAMILSDSGSAVATLVIALLLLANRLEVWHLYVTIAFSSAFRAFQWPAYSAAISVLVPRQHLGRASGLMQFSEAASMIVAPLVAGALIGRIELPGLLLIDLATYVVALVTLFLADVPKPRPAAPEAGVTGSLLREAMAGWHFISARPGLLRLLVYFAGLNFTGGVVLVLLTPLVLSFSTPPVLGRINSFVGVGLLLGGILMSTWGGPRRRLAGITASGLVQTVALILAGLRPEATLIAVGLFVWALSGPIANGCSQVIWQSKTPVELQGRVFSVRSMLAQVASPLAYLLCGPLADRLFEPWMAAGGPLSGTFGRLLGTGPGRGIGLLFVVAGLATLLPSVWALLDPRLRRVEADLPDTLDQEAA